MMAKTLLLYDLEVVTLDLYWLFWKVFLVTCTGLLKNSLHRLCPALLQKQLFSQGSATCAQNQPWKQSNTYRRNRNNRWLYLRQVKLSAVSCLDTGYLPHLYRDNECPKVFRGCHCSLLAAVSCHMSFS